MSDLIDQIVAETVDPDYAATAARDPRPAGRPWGLAVLAVLVGVLVSVSATETSRSAPAAERERADLVQRIRTAEGDQDALRSRLSTLTEETSRLRSAALGDDAGAEALRTTIGTLETGTAAAPVRGPGIEIVVDDAPSQADRTADRVLDIDLQILVNGLWSAGAEAVAVNGRRLSGLTAIRSAGEAITVDYRSLVRPYRVEAIGDPSTLPARFAESSGGAWWNDLAQNRNLVYRTRSVPELTLPADPGLTLRHARTGDR